METQEILKSCFIAQFRRFQKPHTLGDNAEEVNLRMTKVCRGSVRKAEC